MAGSLIYVMGPSGAGKDSLLEIAKKRFAGNQGFAFAKRYVTREAASGGEDFTAISQEDFDRLEADDFFLFSWRGHGLSYGCDRTVERRLAEGKLVVLNGSRAYLKEALTIMPGLKPLLITARNEILAARLKKRGRETAGEQAERLRPLLLENARPRDRSEEELSGYRKALDWIFTKSAREPRNHYGWTNEFSITLFAPGQWLTQD